MGSRVSAAARFGGFAAGHFVVSVLGAAVLFFCVASRVETGWPLALLMLLYIPAGYAVAGLRGWGRPEPREAASAVLLPAAVAWLWAFGGWAMVTGGDQSLGRLGFALLLSTALLASPSFVFMLLVLTGEIGGGIPELPVWHGAMVLAGLLPPLLFFAGTVLPGALGGIAFPPPQSLPPPGEGGDGG